MRFTIFATMAFALSALARPIDTTADTFTTEQTDGTTNAFTTKQEDTITYDLTIDQGKGKHVDFGVQCSARIRKGVAHIKRKHGIPHPEPDDLPNITRCLCTFLADDKFADYHHATAAYYEGWWERNFGQKAAWQAPVPACVNATLWAD